MVLSRRNILRFAPAFLAASATSAAPAAATGEAAPTGTLSREDFQALVNTSFAARTNSGARAWLVLLSVEDLNQKEGVPLPAMAVPPPRQRQPQPRTDAFALHFSGAGAGLTQGTYTLEHSALGTFDLFLVVSGSSSYTAVFNRLLGPSRK